MTLQTHTCYNIILIIIIVIKKKTLSFKTTYNLDDCPIEKFYWKIKFKVRHGTYVDAVPVFYIRY